LNPGVDLMQLPLTPEEGFVASRLDGATDLHSLSIVTGLAQRQVEAALDKLASLGAVAKPEEPETPEVPDAADAPEAPDSPREESAGAHRKLFETTLRQLPPDARAASAATCVEPELSALCFDPVLEVIRELLGNPKFGPVHARLVAAHHHTVAGLDMLASRAAFAADVGVRKGLLRNPQTSAALMRRLIGNRRVLEQHGIATSRELPDQARRAVREIMRSRFATAEADERVEAIVKTEGRCLTLLSGIPVDGKTASLLCARTYSSTLFVQNLARWSAAPPALIGHLLKQELVRRSPALRNALKRHPNAPADADR
jgi:hypothetical protein